MMKFFYALLVALVLASTNGVSADVSADMLENVSDLFLFVWGGPGIVLLRRFCFVLIAFCIRSTHRKACTYSSNEGMNDSNTRVSFVCSMDSPEHVLLKPTYYASIQPTNQLCHFRHLQAEEPMLPESEQGKQTPGLRGLYLRWIPPPKSLGCNMCQVDDDIVERIKAREKRDRCCGPVGKSVKMCDSLWYQYYFCGK